MNKINKYILSIINFIKFVAMLVEDVVRFAIERIRNKEKTNKEVSNKTKPFYQERNEHGFPYAKSK